MKVLVNSDMNRNLLKNLLTLFLNIPYTLIGLIVALFLSPASFEIGSNPYRIIIRVKNESFELGFLRGWRGVAIGNVILLNPREERKDLEHEIVHVLQYQKFPFIFPVLYYFEMWGNGYAKNKYEIEAYSKAGNIYRAATINTSDEHKIK